MIKFTYDLTDHNLVKILPEIKRFTKIDVVKLQNAIDIFQCELNWNDMWTTKDAIERLEKNWYFNVLEINGEIVGWVWFNPIKSELCNLYVNKIYRKQGYGMQLVYSIMNIAKDMNINSIHAMVDEWNNNSQRVFNKCNWKK